MLVADVGEDVVEDRQPAARHGRHVQAGLVHEREQAERPEGDRLAARVRSRDDQRRIAFAQAQVDGHYVTGEARMTGTEQLDDRLVRRRRTDPVHLGGQTGSCAPEVEVGERREVLAKGGRLTADEGRQLVDDARLLCFDGQLRLSPGIA